MFSTATKIVPMALAAALSLMAATALAGGVIIDGRGNPATEADPEPDSGDAGGCPAAIPGTADPTGQQLYLWVAAIMNSHDAAQGGGKPAPGLSLIMDDGETLEVEGGCNALPGSTLAGAIAVLVLRRPKRRSV